MSEWLVERGVEYSIFLIVHWFSTTHMSHSQHHVNYRIVEMQVVVSNHDSMTKIDAFEFDFDKDLDVSDFDKLLEYNKHDIRATELFFDRCRSAVDIRHDLTGSPHIPLNASFLSLIILPLKATSAC
jgi:hypothetical protein